MTPFHTEILTGSDIILQLSNLGIKPFDVLSDVVGNVL